MSLITEALQLRKANPRNRGAGGESFPPMRRPNPAGKVLVGLVFLCGLGVLVFWKGTWAVEQLENLAGIRVNPPLSAPRAAIPEKPVASASPVSPGREAEPVKATMQEQTAPLTEPAGTAKAAVALGVVQAESLVRDAGTEEKKKPASSEVAGNPPAAVPEGLQPMDVNLTLSMIEDEKARQQLDEENQRKIEGFLRRMDIQGVCHQGENSTALVDTVLVRPGDQVGTLGLTLKTIEARRLVFADRNGREYTKSY